MTPTNHEKSIHLAYYYNYATGEGTHIEAELVYGHTEKVRKSQLTIHNPERVEFIPLILKKRGKVGYNSAFKLTFLECFGATPWEAFNKVCIDEQTILDLKINFYFNLS